MVEKIYETLTFLFLVNIGLFMVAIVSLMAEQDQYFEGLLKFITGFVAILAFIFVVTFVADIWV